MIVVQKIVARWTRESRGGAGAARRNAVPKALPLFVESTPVVTEDDRADLW